MMKCKSILFIFFESIIMLDSKINILFIRNIYDNIIITIHIDIKITKIKSSIPIII